MTDTTPAAKWRASGEQDPHAGQYDGERAALALGQLTDDELANAVFMGGNEPLNIERLLAKDPTYHSPIALLTAAKDRIRWLSRALEQALEQQSQAPALHAGVDVADNRFEIPAQGWGEPMPPALPVECPHRCGSLYAKDSYGAGFIEGSGMCPDCDAAMPPKDIVSTDDEPTPPELLAAKLIDAWGSVHGQPVPWEKAVEITAIATSMSNEERDRLLAMADAPDNLTGQVPNHSTDINEMVSRFLSWPLPIDLCADPCAEQPGYPNRCGTNLMNAEQAKAMLEHVMAGAQAGQVPVVLREAIKWADHLCFECGALFQTRAPSVHVYNKTFAAVEAAKALLAAEPEQAKGGE